MKNPIKKALSEKTVVICGASSGIGRAAAIEFAKKGSSLVLAARREWLLQEVAEECLEAGAKQAVAVWADVTDANAMEQVAGTALNLGGGIDVWINNAGIGAVGHYEKIPMNVHEQVVRISLLGHMNGTHAVLPVFKSQGYGVLINTISVGAWTPEPYAVAYTAAKYGLRGFSAALRCELRHFAHIRVCDVYPAYIDTPGFQHGANYIGKKLKPVPPVFSAKRVAGAMVRLAQHPKASTYVGESAHVYRAMHGLSPVLTRNFTTAIMENYFKRAKPAPVSNGAVFQPCTEGTGISGGWLKPKNQKPLIAAALFTASLAGCYLWATRKRYK